MGLELLATWPADRGSSEEAVVVVWEVVLSDGCGGGVRQMVVVVVERERVVVRMEMWSDEVCDGARVDGGRNWVANGFVAVGLVVAARCVRWWVGARCDDDEVREVWQMLVVAVVKEGDGW
ncbi:hypothetical protein Tco_1531225 [Tanacetum coccineum]